MYLSSLFDFANNYTVNYSVDLVEAMNEIRRNKGFDDLMQNYRFILIEWVEKTSVTLHGYVIEKDGEHTWYDIEITPEEETLLIDKLIEKRKEELGVC